MAVATAGFKDRIAFAMGGKMPRRKVDHSEEVVRDVLVGLLIVGAIIGAVTAAIFGLIVQNLLGAPPSARTIGFAFLGGAAPYWAVRVRMRWRFWLNIHSNKSSTESRTKNQAVGSGVANMMSGFFNFSRTKIIHPPAPTPADEEEGVRAAITRVDWGRQTPPSNPTALNVYAKLSNRGGRVGMENAAVRFNLAQGPFELLYSQETLSGIMGAPILESGDVKDYMFRFESKDQNDLASQDCDLTLAWTNGNATVVKFKVPSKT